MGSPIQKALKKAKIKHWVTITIISIAVCVVLLFAFNRFGNYLSAQNTMRLHDNLFLQHSISQPNVNIDSQVTANSSMFGGNIITNRSKSINGYLIPWSTLTSSYSWFGASIDHNELIPGFHSSGNNYYEYDKQTKQKVATFYHPAIEEYYDGVQNQLEAVVQLENQVAEVAISFKKPLTMEQVRENIPKNLNIAWLYMTSRIVDEAPGPSGLPVYGYKDSELSKESFDMFIENLKKYDERGSMEEIQKYIEENENKPFNEVTILGVMLTGRTESFNELLGKDFIRGASVGVTAPIVPYIQPTK
ncbi:sigma factor regulator N-terminal domain-containing protein [Solibacillus sp. A46]|uniref:Sigma factor regulator N-terminal domain-containing protein n=1 Tax=Solibacillus faecavium TaxID=2762221 RepID=A0ABR8Y3G3_9BACL|nr:sigma factor regulator N-terminal domain-containing protein [Solibacillus faecavium]MBD8038734.1 sigma factor regulator N-terminal domain-containing protein [Solibacillus faecavium]